MQTRTNIDLRVVLVRSLYARNIGATSRAMANMGFSRLILIEPQCEINYDAQQAAATGQFALQNRVAYSSWSSFFENEPEGVRFAFTARDGRGRAVQNYSETLSWFLNEHPLAIETKQSDSPVVMYLIFGPEDWGLSAQDLEHSHYAVSIPTFGDNSSLNLAQAVLIGLFMTRQIVGGERTQLDGQQTQVTENSGAKARTLRTENTMKQWLTALGFKLDKPKINVYTTLRRMFFHNIPTEKEIEMLETVLQQNIRKLDEYNRIRNSNLHNLYSAQEHLPDDE